MLTSLGVKSKYKVAGQGVPRESPHQLWAVLENEIRSEMRNPVTKVRVDVLGVDGDQWTSVVAHFKEGSLALEYARNEPFATLPLSGAVITGSLRDMSVDVLSRAQAYKIKCDSHLAYVKLVGALCAWSQTRGPTLTAKQWSPPVPHLSRPQDDLLVCPLEVHFTVANANHQAWQPAVGKLHRSGELLFLQNDHLIYSVNVRSLDVQNIQRVHSSLLDAPYSLFLSPDHGGVGSVYLKFSCNDDYEDWVVSLRSFSRKWVFGGPTHKSTESLRHVHNLCIGGLELKADTFVHNFDFCNLYVDICFDKWVCARTPVWSEMTTPAWLTTFNFDDIGPHGPILTMRLRRASHGYPQETDPYLGTANIASPKGDSQQVCSQFSDTGLSIRFTVKNTIIPVLDGSLYKSLQSQILDPRAQLAQKLADCAPGDLAFVSESFYKLHLAECRHTDWLEELVRSEMANIKKKQGKEIVSANTIFRGNSLMTRIMEKYMQQAGYDLLIQTVGNFVGLVLESDEDFELDPARLSGSDKEIQQALAANIRSVTTYTTKLWQLIRDCGVPTGFSWILSQLSGSLQLELDYTNEQVYSALSSLLFLRFYCPALLNPGLFALTPSHLNSKHRRACTIFAKILQGFANRVKFGSKEVWLMPMNRFSDDYDCELRDWYNNICRGRASLSPEARVPKELPFSQFMLNEITNPYLVDVWQQCSAIAAWGAEVPFNPDWDSTLRAFFLECKSLANTQVAVRKELERPDSLERVLSQSNALVLQMDPSTFYFSTDPEHLTSTVETAQSKRRWRLFNRGHNVTSSRSSSRSR